MQKSSFFNSVNGDRKYKAEEWAEYFASFIGNGVFPNPSTNLMVQANTNMSLVVRAGKAWINGYFFHLTDSLGITLDTADGVLKRIDRIVVCLDLTSRTITLKVKKSVFSATPEPPVLQRDGDVYELALADVAIDNGMTAITQSNISDRRYDSNLCGVVTQTVQTIDTSELSAQLESWFNGLRDILDSNTETKILNLIDDNKVRLDGAEDRLDDLAFKLSDAENKLETLNSFTGSISMYGGSTAPDGWLLCNGALVSRSEYAELFSVIGTSYGVGDGSTTFALPNLQSRFPYGKGGSYALGAKGGAETHALTVAEMPSHTHNLLGDVQNADGSYTRQGYGWRSSMVTGATGGNQPHNNMPPYLVVNYIIKT